MKFTTVRTNGIDNANFRSYDPYTGRWMQPDPLAILTPNMSIYKFGANNPINYTDFLGLFDSRGEAQQFLTDNHLDNTWQVTHSGEYDWIITNGTYSIYEGGKDFVNVAFNEIEVNSSARFLDVVPPSFYAPSLKNNVILTGTPASEIKNPNAQSGGGAQNGYQLADGFGQLLNAGGVFYGGAEMGLQAIRQNNGAQTIGRALGFGTQRTAQALRGTLGVVSKVGKGFGVVGYGLQFASTGSKFVTGQTISTAEGVGFGVSTVLVGAAWFAAGTAAAPFVAGGALIYGVGQLGSYMFTGNTLEENYFGK